jgi:radical SAM superfamily enzyme YgiQ (UPF0313 family)
MNSLNIENSNEAPNQDIDILLVVPPTYPEGRQPDYNPKPPLGLEYLSGYLKKNYFNARIMDYDVIGASVEEVVEDLVRQDPPILGITVLQRALPSVRYIHESLRENGFENCIVYGGIGATLCAEEILREFEDPNCVVVLGEGEKPLNSIVTAIKNGEDFRSTAPSIVYFDNVENTLVSTKIGPLPDLDDIPWPDRQNLEFYTDKSGYLTILTSRGCPWSRCTFCSNAAFEQIHKGETWRSRSPKDVVEEMVDLYKRTEIKKFKTNDPNLFGKGDAGEDYVINLCKEINAAKKEELLPRDLSIMSFIRGEDVAGKKDLLKQMKTTGFDRLLIGVESSVNEVLQKYFKKGESIETLSRAINNLKEVGISPVIGFLIFNPYTTLETLEKDLEFLEKIDLKVNLSKSLRIFNNVPMQFMLVDEGRLEKHSPFETYHEYFVSRDVSAIYHSMKALHVLIEDPIREIAQERIWEIKKTGNSFDSRVGYEDLVETFWEIEVNLLKSCMDYFNSEDFSPEYPERSIKEIYTTIKTELFEKLSLNNSNFLVTEQEFYSNIKRILTEKETDNLHEEYVWNEI